LHERALTVTLRDAFLHVNKTGTLAPGAAVSGSPYFRGIMFSNPSMLRLAIAAIVVPAAMQSVALAQTAAQPGTQTVATLVPVEAFARHPVYKRPRLSPDGKHVAITRRTNIKQRDVQMIVIYRTGDLSVVSETRMPHRMMPADYYWVSNSRLIVSIGKEFGSFEEPMLTGEIMAMDLDAKNQQYLFGMNMQTMSRRGDAYGGDDYGTGFVDAISEARDDKVFVAEHKWGQNVRSTMLYAIDSRKGTRKLVAEVGFPRARFVVQRDGTPRFAFIWSNDAHNVLLRNDTASGQWKEVDVEDGAVPRPIVFNGNDSAYFSRLSAKGGPDTLVQNDPTGAVTRVIASHPVGNIDRIEWGPREAAPVAYATSVGIPALQYVDPASPEAQLHKDLAGQFPGSYVSFESFSDDGSKLLFSTSADRDPGAYYFLDRKTGKADFLFATMPWIDPARAGERRPIMYKARDGLELHGYLTLPPNKPAKNLPMVLMVHGGPFEQTDDWFWDTEAQFLASRGYAVLQVNFRGSGGRGRSFIVSGYREWGGKIQDDLIDGVRWAIGQGVADAGRICTYGGSFGGYSAVMSTIREPGMFKCAIGYVGVYDLPLFMKRKEEDRTRSIPVYFRRTLGEDRAELARQSPALQADKITVPVFLVHGEEDEIAPFEQAKAMRDALKAAGKPFEWMAVPDEGHGFYSEKNRLELYKRMEEFLARHIGR